MRAAKFNVCLVILTLSFFYGGDLRCEAQSLPQEEIDALKQIGAKLKMQWNFSVDPCSGSGGWVKTFDSSYLANNLTCDCNNATNICHVTSIQLRGLNLTGVLPVAFANLKHLTFLDLTRNYLSGSIPAEWASLPLTNISLLGNRVSGKIPDELGNMSTLQSLVLDANKLEGPIPATIGKLTKLSRLFLASNNFSGELPESLGNLKNMSFFGYMAPEYAMRGYLTDKADVYSFGVVTLEIVSGTSNTGYRPKEDFTYLLDWLYVLQEQGRLLELVDPNLGSNYSNEEAMQMLNVCLLCTNPSPTLRPLMSEVVTILEGKRSVKAPSMKPAALNGDDLRYKSLRKQSHDSQTQSISDLPWTDSSISAQSTEGDILHSSSRATANTSS
ncbi:uncharacterized protein A4U43_UnF3220 [Asparagus officinalis]|uniref:Serine-threonine/tyrosine-protein kinase catalytic domain-containing protein n=1 Tax=Asparagus officinalis TaxID=4686 RepID=A0A1R3L792_ASPOF|nr:uncharacterized protein A4U43_UnF3220 [Asparagus officinalis]